MKNNEDIISNIVFVRLFVKAGLCLRLFVGSTNFLIVLIESISFNLRSSTDPFLLDLKTLSNDSGSDEVDDDSVDEATESLEWRVALSTVIHLPFFNL
jgi:hypothetical protein